MDKLLDGQIETTLGTKRFNISVTQMSSWSTDKLIKMIKCGLDL